MVEMTVDVDLEKKEEIRNGGLLFVLTNTRTRDLVGIARGAGAC